MAQFFTPFSDNPTLTEHWHTGIGSFSIETSGLPSGATGGAALKVVMTADDRYAIAWEEAGTPTGDVELLIKWQVDATTSGTSTGTARGIICGAGDSTSETGYFHDHRVTGLGSSQNLAKYDAAAATILDSVTQTLSINTWYRTRIQKTGTTIRARTWADGGAEPGTWQVSATDAAFSGGWVGIGHARSSQTLWVDFIGVGTGGDAAPDEPVGEPQELAGTAAAASDAEAALTLGLNLSGATAGASAVDDATLTLGLNLSGSAAGVSDASADLSSVKALKGLAAASSDASATLSYAAFLSGAASGESDASATLTRSLNLSGSVAGASDANAAMLLGLNLSGSVAGESDASATMLLGLNLSGSVAGASDASANLWLNLARTLPPAVLNDSSTRYTLVDSGVHHVLRRVR